MPYSVILTVPYQKRAKKFLKQHPELISQYEKILLLLEKNPFHPSLRLHKLQGKQNDLFSISINMKYRISLAFLITENEILLVDIGSHDQAYTA